jgi:iron complex transport system substrate-binding protein
MLAAPGLLTGCAQSTPGVAAAPGGATRPVRHLNGTTEVPARSSSVVSLFAHDASALASVGLVPIGAQDGTREWLASFATALDPALRLAELPVTTGTDGLVPALHRARAAIT